MDAKTEEEKAEEKKGFDLNGFNQYRSDRIPLDRTVPDNRHSKSVPPFPKLCSFYIADVIRAHGYQFS